jgi:uncharacterized spore protein YtfJ
MEETQNLVKTSMEEIRGVLSAGRVVGEPNRAHLRELRSHGRRRCG